MKVPNKKVQAKLAERWPHLFSFPVPLKIGIHLDYLAIEPLARPVSRKDFFRFIKRWVKQPEYIQALSRFDARYDFNGHICPRYPDWLKVGGA